MDKSYYLQGKDLEATAAKESYGHGHDEKRLQASQSRALGLQQSLKTPSFLPLRRGGQARHFIKNELMSLGVNVNN